jgi:hypothetical protein
MVRSAGHAVGFLCQAARKQGFCRKCFSFGLKEIFFAEGEIWTKNCNVWRNKLQSVLICTCLHRDAHTPYGLPTRHLMNGCLGDWRSDIEFPTPFLQHPSRNSGTLAFTAIHIMSTETFRFLNEPLALQFTYSNCRKVFSTLRRLTHGHGLYKKGLRIEFRHYWQRVLCCCCNGARNFVSVWLRYFLFKILFHGDVTC